MALFNKVKADTKNPTISAAAGGYSARAAGVGNYVMYQDGAERARLMSIPTISRSRDLIASVISTMPLIMYKQAWNGEEMEDVPLAPRSWLRRLDKSIPNSTLFSWLFDDILFTQTAYLYVTERTADGYPSAFTRLPAAMVTMQDQQTGVKFAPSKQLLFNGQPIDHKDVVQFIGPQQGLNTVSPTAVTTALKLERARLTNAAATQPALTLRQVGGEPMSSQELTDLAAAFDNARLTNSTAAVNEFVEVIPNMATPDKMLLVDASNYQSLEMARLANVPPYLLGINTGSMNYQSSENARADLLIFGARPYAECIAETLSGDNVLPRGTYVKFDYEAYLGEMAAASVMDIDETVDNPNMGTSTQVEIGNGEND